MSSRSPRCRAILQHLLSVRLKANTDPWAPYLTALSAIRLGLANPRVVETAIPDAEGIADAFEDYRSVLRDRKLLDFDEQIYGAIERLLSDQPARAQAQASCRHLLVDEFQDLTPAHVLLLRLLAAPAYDVFGVGDDDQVIYSYAAASPRFLIDYDQYFPGAAGYALEVNYRCPPTVVGATRNLLSHNSIRIKKTIRAAAGRPDDEAALDVVSEPDDQHALVALEVLRGWNQSGERWSDLAVLARVNAALLPIQAALVNAGIPFVSPLDRTILLRTGVRTALAYLRIALDPESIKAADIRETIRRPSRRIRPDVEAQLTARPTTSLRGLRQALRAFDDRDADKVALFIRDLDKVAATAGRDTAFILRTIRDDVGVGRAMDVLDTSRRQPASTHGDDLAALEQAAALWADATTFESWITNTLDHQGDPDGVVLSTVHRVKGQEWPHVIVFGADDGAFPHRLATDEEEERRIFHVAITRASRSVVVLADAEAPSPFCHQLRHEAVPLREPPQARPATRTGPDRAMGRPPVDYPVELGAEVVIQGGLAAQIVDWNRLAAVAATGKARRCATCASSWFSSASRTTPRRASRRSSRSARLDGRAAEGSVARWLALGRRAFVEAEAAGHRESGVSRERRVRRGERAEPEGRAAG